MQCLSYGLPCIPIILWNDIKFLCICIFHLMLLSKPTVWAVSAPTPFDPCCSRSILPPMIPGLPALNT